MSAINDCPVCYDEKDLIKFHCSHELCYDCYSKLDGNVKKCPLCRAELVNLSLVGSIGHDNNLCVELSFIRDVIFNSDPFTPTFVIDFISLYPDIDTNELPINNVGAVLVGLDGIRNIFMGPDQTVTNAPVIRNRTHTGIIELLDDQKIDEQKNNEIVSERKEMLNHNLENIIFRQNRKNTIRQNRNQNSRANLGRNNRR
jgi:hypothetical protein